MFKILEEISHHKKLSDGFPTNLKHQRNVENEIGFEGMLICFVMDTETDSSLPLGITVPFETILRCS